jgi:cysteine desulfuration protein SufE
MKSASLDDILETFDAVDDWMDRYQYLIDLGKRLPELESAAKVEENRVLGCTSRVWLVATRQDDGRYELRVDSDAAIVKGLLQVVLALYDGKSAAEIALVDHAGVFAQLGLDQHLSPSRSNGLRSVVDRVRRLAA